ncbi:MAG TPA: hypothetical protein VH186_01035 [Chloroflexia bacterium]|nr:hypothetical protein [Chloroflexia bacterium]
MKIATQATETNQEKRIKAEGRSGGGLIRRELVVVAGYALLAILFTWPLLLHFAEAAPGENHGDVWQMVWNLWWVRYALEHFQNPFHTDLMFYPSGADLYLHALNALNGVVSLPVQLVAGALGGAASGAVAGYNFIVLLSLTLGAYGAFCLARYLWGDWKAALLAGLGYGFCTYNFDHLLGHLNLVSSEFIPFYILFFLKALHSPAVQVAAPSFWKRAWQVLGPVLPAVLCLVALTFLELQYVLYMAFFSLLYLLYITITGGWQFLRKKTGGVNLALVYGRALLLVTLFVVVTLPFTWQMAREALDNPNTVPLRQENVYSADLLAYFYPSPFQPLWGSAMQRAIRPFTATLIEKVVFPGFTVYLLILLGLLLWAWNRFRNRASSEREEVTAPVNRPGIVFWLVVAAFFALLSFGPRLHINGIEHGPTLPGALIYRLPVLNITRVPARFAVVALLALALLAAWGLVRLRLLLPGKVRFYNGVVAVALLALGFELLPAPYPLAFYQVPAFYQTLANDPRSDYSILEVPLNYGSHQYETAYLEAQMLHGKPLLNGYISRNPVFPPYYGAPVFLNFRDLNPQVKPDILPSQSLDAGILRYFGVRYVVIRKDLLEGAEKARAFDVVGKFLPDQKPVADSPELTAYEVPAGPKADFFYNLMLPTWYDAEKGPDGKMSRWVQGSEAKMDFWTTTPRSLNVEFAAWSFQQAHPVEFLLNGRSLLQQEIGLNPQTIKLKLDLQPGQNQLTLKIGGKPISPAELGMGNDPRSFTISVGELKFS